MASPEEELRHMKEINIGLAQKTQYWKMLAGQRENEKLDLMKEKLDLMKENNEFKLKLSRLMRNGNVLASNLNSALQSAVQKALEHMVRASGEITTVIDLATNYMQHREELNNESPRCSLMGGTPSSAKKDKVHRVPPLMIGGQSIQPVVALTMLDTSNTRSAVRSSNANRNVTERAVPMHMLQDLYIPLTRIDVDMQSQNMETEDSNNADDSTRHMQLDDNEEQVAEDSQRMDEDEEFDESRKLQAVAEESETENEERTPRNINTENPLEGPSWLLDVSNNTQPSTSKSRNLEPDSTTGLEHFRNSPPNPDQKNKTDGNTPVLVPAVRQSREFSPTVRRRKRPSSPPPPAATPRRAPQYSPCPTPPRRISNSGRVLKVVVAKMRLDLDAEGGAGGAGAGGSPAKRAASAAAHAPSPNGATVPGVIVSETSQNALETLSSGEPSPIIQTHRNRRPRGAGDNLEWTDNLEQRGTTADRWTESKDRIDWLNLNPNTRTDREKNKQTDNVEEHQINVEKQMNTTERNEQTERVNERGESDMQTNEDNIEHHVNVNRGSNSRGKTDRTNSRERNKERMEQQRSGSSELNEQNKERHEQSNSNERMNSRERNKQTSREHAMETASHNKEAKERSRRERIERSNSKDRSQSTERNREHAMEIESHNRERHERRNRDRERTNSIERTGRQTDADRFNRRGNVDKADYRHKQSHSRDRSDDRIDDLRADSRASNNSTRQDDSRASSAAARAGSCDSDSGSGGERDARTRRTRNIVTYKEKPLNRKMRR